MTLVLRFTCALDPLYGGVPHGIALISRETSKFGQRTMVISYGNSKGAIRRFSNELEKLKISGTGVITSKAIFSNPYGLGGFFSTFLSLSKLKKPELVVLHQIWTLSTLYGYFYSRLYRTRLAIMPHGSLSKYHQIRNGKLKKIVNHLIINRILKAADFIVVTSNLEKMELNFLLREKATVIPYGTDIQITDYIQKIPFRIIFVGRITKKKNLDQIIRALPKILEEFPSATFVVAGEGTSLEVALLKKLAVELNVENSITFLGWLDRKELLTQLTRAQVLLLPSEYENFGHAVLESLACATPVVISNKVALSEIVSKYNSGIVIQNNNSVEISNAVRAILLQPSEFSRAAKLASRSEFSWESISEIWRSLGEI